MPKTFRVRFAAACFLLAAVVVSGVGCGKDAPLISEPDPVPEPEPLVLISPDALMNEFVEAYEGMLIAHLDEMLHDDFEMPLLAEVLADWSWGEGFRFDRADMISIHTNLFTGEPGMDEQGNVVHPVDSTRLPLLEALGPWDDVDAEDAWFGGIDGAKAAPYRLQVEFYNADQSHKYSVMQTVFFYAVDVAAADEDPSWRLLGIRTLPVLSKGETMSWDEILCYYR